MALFNDFPFANYHELNLDWLIRTVKKLETGFEEYKEQIASVIKDNLDSILFKVLYDADSRMITLSTKQSGTEEARISALEADQVRQDAEIYNAQSTADGVAGTANNALSKATAAESTATTAFDEALNAQSTAQNLENTVSGYDARITTAQQSATDAYNKSVANESNIESVRATASSASEMADTALTTAESAQSTADSVSETANNALTKANNANAQANGALTKAEAALTASSNNKTTITDLAAHVEAIEQDAVTVAQGSDEDIIIEKIFAGGAASMVIEHREEGTTNNV